MFTVIFDADKCVSCGACADACPFCAITITNGVPSADGRCHICSACADVCPVGAITVP